MCRLVVSLATCGFVASALVWPPSLPQVVATGERCRNAIGSGLISVALLCSASPAWSMNDADVRYALQTWCDGIVEIGRVYEEGGDYRTKAREVIEANYAFDQGEAGSTATKLLFKPTRASEHPFRSTEDEFLSYFVGGRYSEDSGFAISPRWSKVRFDNYGTYFAEGGSCATAMGHYYFTSAVDSSSQVEAEYTFHFVQVGDRLKIAVHHSSLPYANRKS